MSVETLPPRSPFGPGAALFVGEDARARSDDRNPVSVRDTRVETIPDFYDAAFDLINAIWQARSGHSPPASSAMANSGPMTPMVPMPYAIQERISRFAR